MKNAFLLLLCSLLVATSSLRAGNEANSPDFSSPEALMRLVPELRSVDGKFQIPNPRTDLAKYLRVHHALTNLIEAALIQCAARADLGAISRTQPESLKIPPDWRSAEVGVMTNGTKPSFPDDGQFTSFGGVSFLSGIKPIPGTGGSFYQVVKPDGSCPAIVYAEATLLPTVNRIALAAANTGGTWQPPSYALGNARGEAWLIIDKCVDVALTGSAAGTPVLLPNAELFVAIHWADTPEMAHLRTDQPAHNHGGSGQVPHATSTHQP